MQAHNPSNPSVEVNLRVILDSGSQRSYVTQRVKDALSLVPSNKQSLSIAALEQEEGLRDLMRWYVLWLKADLATSKNWSYL